MIRPRVLQLLYDHGNAISQVCNEYTRALDRRRYEITVAYLYGPRDPGVIAGTDADNVIFLDLPKREPLGLRVRALSAVGRLLGDGCFDYVICHRYKTTRLAAWVQLVRPVPTLMYVVHGIGYMTGWRRRLSAWCFFRKLSYVAVSRAVGDDLARSVPGLDESRIFMVHNTLDLKALETARLGRKEARRALGLPAEAFVFGTVGRLVTVKRQALLIEALASIRDRADDTCLAIIGGGRLEGELRRFAGELGVENRVVLCGEHPWAARLMSAFDVFVFASREESFGLVLIEAMAARLPIITSASGGITEVVGPDALLVEDHGHEAFAKQMLELHRMSRANRDALGAPGYERVQSEFSRSTIVDVLTSLQDSAPAPAGRTGA